jgi:UDP-glucose 4-epimerase
MTPQTWLITGGAGYIGSHIADEFLANGKEVVIYDPLYRGLESRLEYLRKKYKKHIPLVVADIRETDIFANALAQFKPHGIIHTAGLKAVGESVEKSDEYFEVNFHATTKILNLAAHYKIKDFIFSSTAAVYGAPENANLIKENAPKNPISPYGASKLAAEGEMNKFLLRPGNHGTSLRFFNVVGTSAPELTDNSEENLVPIVIKKIMQGEAPIVFGTDYSTSDGTCIRDYVDVRDVARAHLAVATFVGALPVALNIGTGRGHTVREVIKLVSEAAGKSDVPTIDAGRRPGDSAFLCADVSLIMKQIGFSARYSLATSVRTLF